ncbi:MAG: hypothetical protein II147_00585 [Lachnospiraceae bacterium]|jgi:RNA polymerase subunit RPABC4/transcription elongation factor Spt4|nr:hypothetical protein [Lachnospiraceae bacterium]
MQNKKSFFGNYKYCEGCHQLLESNYEFDMCPSCIEQEVFKQVRDYIRNNEVTEYEVAERFQLPIERVKAWIREGRIQYQDKPGEKALGQRCARCGVLILQGEFCPKCLKFLRTPKGTLVHNPLMDEESKMRFLNNKQD